MSGGDGLHGSSDRGTDFLALPEEERLRIALREAPRGAFALGLLSVTLLIVGWLLIYFLAFIPRGTVG